jgi:tRNA (guanine10-N2)-dimethyltransferase
MKYLFEILGDHEALGKAEILSVMRAYDDRFKVLEEDDEVLAVDTNVPLEVFEKRLGLTRNISEYLVSGDVESIMSYFEDLDLKAESFGVRAKRVMNHQSSISTLDLGKSIGGILSKSAKVDLENPEVEVRVVVSGRCHAGLKVAEFDRSTFEKRKVRFRQFFSPISLHPKLARALVNLSRAREGEVLLDPFCGTGGVLIEAGLVGARVVGSDLDSSMVEGCEANLRAEGIEGDFFTSDVSNVPDKIGAVHAVATDPPYGRSASTKGEDLSSLYERSFVSMKKILKPGGYLAIILPGKEHVELCADYLKLEESFEVRVHKSLTRLFNVFRNE